MAEYPVYTGHWVDWSKGRMIGSQVTMSNSASNVLIALVAVFITFVGGIAWSTIAYAIHQIRSTKESRDGLFHLQQAILRNTSSPITFVVDLIRTSLAWKDLSRPRAFAKSTGLAVSALVIYTFFVASGVLLSFIGETGDVLLQSPTCLTWSDSLANNLTADEYQKFSAGLGAWEQQELNQILSYGQECYPSLLDSAGGAASVAMRAPASNCNFYSKTALKWTTSYPGSCPFAEAVCAGSASDIIQFDTGYLDTTLDLGINDKAQDRLQFRKVTTCAPLTLTNFSSGDFVDTPFGKVMTYNYGLNVYQPQSINYTTFASVDNSDITFVYPHSAYSASSLPYFVQTASTIEALSLLNGTLLKTFYPRPDLGHDSSRSLSLFFLANRARFLTQPIDDLWFTATETTSNPTPNFEDITVYYSSQPGAVIGCVDDIELCNPNLPSNKCVSAIDLVEGSDYYLPNLTNSPISAALNLNRHQENLAGELATTLFFGMMTTIFRQLGARALVANDYLFNGQVDILSSALAPNQWHVEFQRFQAISMATLQRYPFAAAAGPTDPELLAHFEPYPPELGWICNSYKFRSAAYFSYSVLSISLVFGIGGAITLFSLVVTLLVPMIQLRTGRGRYRRDQWYTNGTLFLQASLYDAKALGSWTTSPVDKIPTTTAREAFPAYVETSAGMELEPDRSGGAKGAAKTSCGSLLTKSVQSNTTVCHDTADTKDAGKSSLDSTMSSGTICADATSADGSSDASSRPSVEAGLLPSATRASWSDAVVLAAVRAAGLGDGWVSLRVSCTDLDVEGG